MNKKDTRVMTCGACAISIDANGEATTSIDVLVNGVKRLFAKANRH